MVNCYHGTENLPVQFSCPSQSNLHSLLENKEMISMEQENGKMPWREMDKLRMCNAVKSDELWNGTYKYKQLNELQSHVIASKLNIAPIEKFAANLMSKLITDALLVSCKITWSIPCSQICHMSDSLPLQENLGNWSGLRLCWTPELFQGSNNRESSRSSLSSRLSSSHNSLATNRVDESSFITSAASHDVLSSSQSSDMYNVPLDSDNYAVPIDVKSDNPKPPLRTKKRHVQERQLRSVEKVPVRSTKGRKLSSQSNAHSSAMRNSLRSGSSFKDSRPACSTSEPIHLTLQEVRQCIHDLYASTSDESGNRDGQETFNSINNPFNSVQSNASAIKCTSNYNNNIIINNNNCYNKNRKNAFSVMVKSKRAKENCESSNGSVKKTSPCRPSFSLSLKQALCNIFRFKRLPTPDQCLGKRETIFHSDEIGVRLSGHDDHNPPSPITKPPLSNRALPPLPKLKENLGGIIVTDSNPLSSPEDVPPLPPRSNTKQNRKDEDEQSAIDFASSIEKVKDYGWYWGPISGEAAEKILSNEPDGSFIVRDSSDNYYIFSLTFKLNSVIRHVRIEHDRGKFSFGSSHRFKSNTIVDFIESAVEHSRSGRYLFFLHRRPVLGPMRVQLLHPVSRFKRVQSLQHLCRFVILKLVRKDLIRDLPLPTRVLDYLSKQHYYSEQLFEEEESDSSFQEELNQFLCFSNEKFS